MHCASSLRLLRCNVMSAPATGVVFSLLTFGWLCLFLKKIGKTKHPPQPRSKGHPSSGWEGIKKTEAVERYPTPQQHDFGFISLGEHHRFTIASITVIPLPWHLKPPPPRTQSPNLPSTFPSTTSKCQMARSRRLIPLVHFMLLLGWDTPCQILCH